MKSELKGYHNAPSAARFAVGVICVAVIALLCPFNLFSETTTPQRRGVSHRAVRHNQGAAMPDSIAISQPISGQAEVVGEMITNVGDSLVFTPVDTVSVLSDRALLVDTVFTPPTTSEWEPRLTEFNPDPTRAVWLSALLPGLGQIYNRRYWKLPIIVGGYLGLGYATNWNNNMLSDYTRAYSDILDNDPNTKSYMDFFPSTTKEEDLDKTWLTNVLKARKDYYRRNRDLCIICMVGVYLVAMVDAYVDASLSHFDISPDLSLKWAPAVIQDTHSRYPSVGVQWALNF